MPFERPTLKEIEERLRQDLRVDEGLRWSVEAVLASALAGAAHSLHGHLDWTARQLFPTTGDPDVVERWSSLFGLARRSAVAASGAVRFVAAAGAELAAGTELRVADGRKFRLAAPASEAGGEIDAQVVALEAGAAGNTPTGVAISLVSPVAGVEREGEVLAPGLGGGAQQESTDALLIRLLQRVREETRGGGPGDYVRWALEVPGVARAWQYPLHLGPGTVGLTFTTADGPIPSGGEVSAVQAHLDTKRPVTADVTVFAPIEHPVNFELEISPDTPANRSQVEAELQWAIASRAAPGDRILYSHLLAALAGIDTLQDFDLVHPSGNITPSPGHLPVPGDFTWVGD